MTRTNRIKSGCNAIRTLQLLGGLTGSLGKHIQPPRFSAKSHRKPRQSCAGGRGQGAAGTGNEMSPKSASKLCCPSPGVFQARLPWDREVSLGGFQLLPNPWEWEGCASISSNTANLPQVQNPTWAQQGEALQWNPRHIIPGMAAGIIAMAAPCPAPGCTNSPELTAGS